MPFMSVMTNEANLINRFGVTTIPVSPYAVAERAKKLIADNDPAFAAYYDDLTARMDSSAHDGRKCKKGRGHQDRHPGDHGGKQLFRGSL